MKLRQSCLFLCMVILTSARANGESPGGQDSLPAGIPEVSLPDGAPAASGAAHRLAAFRVKTDAASFLSGALAAEAASRPGVDAGMPGSGATDPGGAPAPPPRVRKPPLILGIAGAAIMVVGIAMAQDSGTLISFRKAGIVTACVGGGIAVTGFYLAFRR
jgi:hypothetical protein